MAFPMTGQQNDDPRKLRTLLARATDLAEVHAMPSVVVGLATREGDLRFPEFVDFVQSALRVEDGIFRMTRERAVLHLADLDEAKAREVLERLVGDFGDEFPSSTPPHVDLRFFEVTPPGAELSVKDVLKTIFAPDPDSSLH